MARGPSEGSFSFEDISYGESAAGKNRFMPPGPIKPWVGVRVAIVLILNGARRGPEPPRKLLLRIKALEDRRFMECNSIV
jgi:hypothetical protein